MKPRSAATGLAVPPWTLAVTAMLSVQLGSALSIGLIRDVGPAGTAWLRLSIGGLIFLGIARPRLRAIRRRDLPVLIGLGVATGLQMIAFLASIERIPLGTCVAIEFLGPLSVAAARARNRRSLTWPALALLGVVLLTQPWQGTLEPVGLLLAALAAVGWAAYIVLTQQVGDRFAGLSGLAITVPIAAVTAAIVGIPQASGHLTLGVVLAGAGLALLLPVLPYAFELVALRHMSHIAFGTLMALEPAIGVVLGLLVLHQTLSAVQILGITLVVLAGTGAQRTGRRRPRPPGADVPRRSASTRAGNLRSRRTGAVQP